MPDTRVQIAPWSVARDTVRTVSQYANKTNVVVSLTDVSVSALHPLCRLVRTYRLGRVSDLVSMYTAAEIPFFAPVWMSSLDANPLLICPPIIERHGTQSVVVDGTHRLFHALQIGVKTVKVVVVSGILPPLPGKALNWDQVELVDRSTPREAKFDGYRDEHFRQISSCIDGRQQ